MIDELNALRRPLDLEGAKFLRDHFLDSEKRYLVYTTHVLMDLEGVCVADSLGRRTDNNSDAMKKSSNRSYKTFRMPQSFDLEWIRAMPSCNAVSETLVSLCSGIPSLIYSEMYLHEEPLPVRFATRIGVRVSTDEQREVFSDFVEEVISGNRGAEAKCRRFDIVSSVLDVVKIQWPMCYIYWMHM